LRTKPGYDYSALDETGIVRENTPVTDHLIMMGMATRSISGASAGSSPPPAKDASISAKKGQVGFVDRTFMTEGEEGQRMAKVRIREDRVPALGDKMASRSGQKGTIGLIVPEADMPFTADGVRPDLIINPHAIPSRMTVGQLVGCLLGKAAAAHGGYGDCTAFNDAGINRVKAYGELLNAMGYHSTGNEIVYNGMTGEQVEMEVFMGPTYYMRLKHMVKDKINYRALGPNAALTRQPVSGRANDGGLRMGEMERDSVLGHGANFFLQDSMMERADKYFVTVCNQTGMLAVANPSRNLLLSPMADGPVRFEGARADDLRLHTI